MQKRVPVAREERPPLPDFTPVPRRNNRHDGWTPERQRAFIEALADTGSVSRAARMVNMAQANCYTLRRAPGAESFRAAWEAALDFGVQRLKDIAFERAIDGELIPVFVGGRLMGYRRKRNDALLMFCLRHYGQDANGKRTTINYFSTRASAGVGAGDGAAGGAAGAVAEAAIGAALAACAARKRTLEAAQGRGAMLRREAEVDDPEIDFVATDPEGFAWEGTLEPPVMLEEWVPFVPGEDPWEQIGADAPERVALPVASRGDGASTAADPER